MLQNGAGGVSGAPPAAAAPQSNGGGAPGQTPAAQPPAGPDYRALHEEAQRKLAAVEKERETERLNALKEKKAREKDEEARKKDLPGYLKSTYGDDWYDIVTKAKTGTVSPAGVSSALSDVEQRLEAKFAEREKELRAELAEVKTRDLERQRQDYLRGASEYVRANPDKYPLLHAYKQIDDVGGFIDGHFQMTSRSGQGEVWTHEVGAQKLEEYWGKVKEMILQHERGRPSEAPSRLTIIPPKGDGRGPETDEERRARLDKVFAEASAKWKSGLSGTRAN